MPGLPFPNHDAANNGSEFSYPRCTCQTCVQQSRAQLSLDEELAPEKYLALYWKPVVLYDKIQKRAIENPLSLQRCLSYKIDARRKKRVQISISINGSTNAELPAHGIFPLHVLFARATSNDSLDGHSPVYRFSRACLLTSFHESGDNDHSKATFTIPDLKSLATSQVCNSDIILISYGKHGKSFSENFSDNHMEYSSHQKLGGQCSWGKIPIDLLGPSLDNCVALSLGRTVELNSEISMSPGFIEPTFLEHGSCFTFCSRKADATGSYELQASIHAQEAGAQDMQKSLYNDYSYADVPLSSLPLIIRLRTGNVLFEYKHRQKLVRTEVTEDFSCAFCWVPCGSFKGLEYHLTSSHELFHYEFLVTKDYQTVCVSLKGDSRKPELPSTAGDEGDERNENQFFYRSRFKKRCRRSETTIKKTKHVHPHILEPGSPARTVPVDKDVESRSPGNMGDVDAHTTESGASKVAHKGSEVDYVPNENVSRRPVPVVAFFPHSGTSVPQASIDSHPTLDGTSHSTPSVLQFGKSRKLSVDRDDPRNRLLLQKRDFFHSHKAQKMELEDVLADHDSEDEIDDDIADLEDMTMLDGFAGVAKDEKRIMHMWNSFVRRQRVLADGHIPWACDAFSRQHGQELVDNPSLRWCWRLVMVKLWNHSLLDARTIDTCNKFLDSLERESSDPMQT